MRAIAIESRAAQAVGPPRQPHRAVLVPEYPGETVRRLHAHQDLNCGHGESLNDLTRLDELKASSMSRQPQSYPGSVRRTRLAADVRSARRGEAGLNRGTSNETRKIAVGGPPSAGLPSVPAVLSKLESCRIRHGASGPELGHNDADDRPVMALTYPDPGLTDAVVRLRRWRETDIDCIRGARATRRSDATAAGPEPCGRASRHDLTSQHADIFAPGARVTRESPSTRRESFRCPRILDVGES
jgi:hypothetical protein